MRLGCPAPPRRKPHSALPAPSTKVSPVRVRSVCLTAALLAAVCAAALAIGAPGGEGATAKTFGASGRWLTYADGRVFLPHGVNTIVTAPPYFNDRLTAADARFLATEGFT